MNYSAALSLAVSTLTAAVPPAVFAGDNASIPGMSTAAAAAPSSQAQFTLGEVRRVDVAQGKVTIKHGPLDNLGMPAMTMVFRLANPAVLGKLKVGDIIKFRADKIDGAFTVVELQAGA